MIAPAPTILRLPRLYPKQKRAIFAPERYVVIEASTKSGKTVGCMAWIIAQAIERGGEGRNFWWVAPIFPQTKIAYRRIKRMLARADGAKQHWDCNESELWIKLENGSMIWFKSGDHPDSLYGEDVYAAVIDEASRCKEDSWYAIRSTLTATQGQLRIIGNVKGRKNWAYQMARRAQSGEPDMAYFTINAYDAVEAGVLPLEEVEDAKRLLPEQVFNELYLNIPSDDGGNPFGLAAIRACIMPEPLTDSHAPPVCYGVDLAKSHDWVVIIGLNAAGQVQTFQRWQGSWESTTSRLISIIGHAPAFIDSTGVGDPIVERIQAKCGAITGYNFSGGRKQPLMEGLAWAIQNRAVAYPDGEIVRELESYEYEYKPSGVRYTCPEGLHDDCVCALALAVMCKARSPVFDFRLVGGERGKRVPENRMADIDNSRMWTEVEV